MALSVLIEARSLMSIKYQRRSLSKIDVSQKKNKARRQRLGLVDG